MDRLESNFGVRVMSFIFKLRDFFLPRKDVPLSTPNDDESKN